LNHLILLKTIQPGWCISNALKARLYGFPPPDRAGFKVLLKMAAEPPPQPSGLKGPSNLKTLRLEAGQT